MFASTQVLNNDAKRDATTLILGSVLQSLAQLLRQHIQVRKARF